MRLRATATHPRRAPPLPRSASKRHTPIESVVPGSTAAACLPGGYSEPETPGATKAIKAGCRSDPSLPREQSLASS